MQDKDLGKKKKRFNLTQNIISIEITSVVLLEL